jgi:ribonucleoside-diphosphate reductase alpha chain
MRFERCFTNEVDGPYGGITWEKRKSELRDAEGKILFSQDNVVVPSFWSQIATDILAQKYFRKRGVPKEKEFEWTKNVRNDFKSDIKFNGGEYDARQVFHRLAYTWLKWGKEEGFFDDVKSEQVFYEETLYMLAHQIAAPNSPQWFNTGLYEVYGIEGSSQGKYYYNEILEKVVHSENDYIRPQTSACFILKVNDDLLDKNGIYDTIVKEACLFKYGAGAGSNFSAIRGAGEKLSGGGISSGLLSFLKIGDRSAAAIKSGGANRRASKMHTVDIDHPDIEEFIDWKPQEEYKVSTMVTGSTIIKRHLKAIENAVISQYLAHDDNAYDVTKNKQLKKALSDALRDNIPENYLYQVLYELKTYGNIKEPEQYSVAWEDEPYNTVSGQTSNNSIRITDKFMEAVKNDDDGELKARTTGEVTKKIKALDLWNKIIRSVWKCADPGLQFHDTINRWHTCPQGGEIKASNPCGEFMFIDSSACNLASINLTALYHNGNFDIEKYSYAIKIWTTILEISIIMAQFPSEDIAKNAYEYRPLGLGFAGLGSLLMKMGLPYDSQSGRMIARGISSLLTAKAYAQSIMIAIDTKKSFKKYAENREDMLKVIKMHYDANETIEVIPSSYEVRKQANKRSIDTTISFLKNEATGTWKGVYNLGKSCGFRNAQVTCIAPTGTIGLLMDCDTTGIEPDFALVKYKKLAGGGTFKIINSSIKESLQNLGYTDTEIEEIEKYVEDNMCIEGAPHILKEHLDIFDTATPSGPSGRYINWKAHIYMMEAVQPFISGAISKTINMPSNCTYEDIEEAYMLSWKDRLKSITVYRDQSKLSQPLLSSQNTIYDPILKSIVESKKNLNEETISETPIDTVSSLMTFSWQKEALKEKKSEEDNIPIRIKKESKIGRKALPSRRKGYIQKSKIAGHSLFLHTGEYEDGNLGEIFIDMHREGAAFRSLLNSFAIAVSLGLQYGVPLEEYIDAFVFSKFEPNGMVQGHKYIKMVTSVIDYIFRDLAITYLGRHDLGQVKPEDLNTTDVAQDKEEFGYAKLESKEEQIKRFRYLHQKMKQKKEKIFGMTHNEINDLADALAYGNKRDANIDLIKQARERGYEGDPCPTCGAFTLIRNGTCMKCDTCGNTTGCS